MKRYIIMSLVMALLTVAFVFSSCKKDDEMPDKPIITLTEVGHDNSRHAHPGHDMHLEADVLADGLISRIDIEIHQESGNCFEIEKAYTDGKYIGVKNIEFHEHVDIPVDAPIGEYHLHFTVTDKEGQQTTAECHIEIVEDDDDEDDDEHGHSHNE